jgi:thiosulfate dehydrogenase
MTTHDVSKSKLAMLAVVTALVLQACGGGSDKTTDDDTNGGGSGSAAFDSCLTNSNNQAFVAQLGSVDITRGGLLYDKWYAAANNGVGLQAPADNHPLWSTRDTINGGQNNTTSGADTYRCKECHGWDYQGSDGAYGNPASSHYTGFGGLTLAADKPAIEVFCAIAAGDVDGVSHVFGSDEGGWLSDSELAQLTKLITDPNGIKNADRNVAGDGTVNLVATGKDAATLYSQRGCASVACHDADGTVNVGDHAGLGELASDNPWETLHKIRFGSPGIGNDGFSRMPGFEGLESFDDLSNIVAYAQTNLAGGTGGGSADTIEGGLLYDKWWVVTGAAEPVTDNPVWPLRAQDAQGQYFNTRSGADTWRCKECHGWDYKGADGAYDETSSHYTGFPSLLARRANLTEEGVVSYLTNGVPDPASPGQRLHWFGPGSPANLTAAQISSLAKFIMDDQGNGIVDTDAYIRPEFKAGKGDAAAGGTKYTNGASASGQLSCASVACHGPNGQLIDFNNDPLNPEYLPGLARDNPWEVLHKARFGQPGEEAMTPVLSWGTSEDASDILTYIMEQL